MLPICYQFNPSFLPFPKILSPRILEQYHISRSSSDSFPHTGSSLFDIRCEHKIPDFLNMQKQRSFCEKGDIFQNDVAFNLTDLGVRHSYLVSRDNFKAPFPNLRRFFSKYVFSSKIKKSKFLKIYYFRWKNPDIKKGEKILPIFWKGTKKLSLTPCSPNMNA